MAELYGLCPTCGGGIYKVGVIHGCPNCDFEDDCEKELRKFKDKAKCDGKRKKQKPRASKKSYGNL